MTEVGADREPRAEELTLAVLYCHSCGRALTNVLLSGSESRSCGTHEHEVAVYAIDGSGRPSVRRVPAGQEIAVSS